VLAPEYVGRIDQAMRYYSDNRHPDTKAMRGFRERYAVNREVYLIGVWDTVGALGVPAGFVGRRISEWRNEFHDTKLNPLVAHAYHALALDERRESFSPTFWERSSQAPSAQQLEQLWFPGSHADIGGGGEASGLADISLHWMQQRARAAGLGFRRALRFTPSPDPIAPLNYADRGWPMPLAAREIDACAPGCAFHESVLLRIKGDATYQPGNLLRGDRRALLGSLNTVAT
jgi:hypothetical protein